MKVKIIILLMLFSIFSLSAFPTIGLSFDTLCIQDLRQKQSYQFNADLRLKTSQDFQVRLPVTFTMAKSSYMAEGSLSLAYYPFNNGFYVLIPAIDFAYYDKSFIALNEIAAGYTFSFNKKIIVEPEICIRDPSGTYSDEYATLRGHFKSYSSFRFRLKLVWNFYEGEIL